MGKNKAKTCTAICGNMEENVENRDLPEIKNKAYVWRREPANT